MKIMGHGRYSDRMTNGKIYYKVQMDLNIKAKIKVPKLVAETMNHCINDLPTVRQSGNYSLDCTSGSIPSRSKIQVFKKKAIKVF